MIEGGVSMKIPEHQSNKYNLKPLLQKRNRVKKSHEDNFENELEDSIKKKKSQTDQITKNSSKKSTLKKLTHQKDRKVSNHFSNWI